MGENMLQLILKFWVLVMIRNLNQRDVLFVACQILSMVAKNSPRPPAEETLLVMLQIFFNT